MNSQPLTHYSFYGGCAAKIPPNDLSEILDGLQFKSIHTKGIINNRLDAGIIKLDRNELIQSIDVITPICNDEYSFGGISASHALSDIYTLRANPIGVLIYLGYPPHLVEESRIVKILQGAIDKYEDSGAEVLGGHTISTKNQIYIGGAVTGIRNSKRKKSINCNPGDKLFISKPIGNGIHSSAAKMLSAGIEINNYHKDDFSKVIISMLELNNWYLKKGLNTGVNFCTDITGFGLIEHLCQKLKAKNVSAEISFESIPFFDKVNQLLQQEIYSSGAEKNLFFVDKKIEYHKKIKYINKLLLNDPQTSGGLLLCVSSEKLSKFLENIKNSNVKIYEIGKIIEQFDKNKILKVI